MHAFIDSPKEGAQLASLMERIKILSGIDQQRNCNVTLAWKPESLWNGKAVGAQQNQEIVTDDSKSKPNNWGSHGRRDLQPNTSQGS